MGPILTGGVDHVVDGAVREVARRRDQLISVLEVLSTTPSPPGNERALAEQLAAWCETGLDVGHVRCDLDVFDGERANLHVHRGRADGLACYAHLDTSLTGDPSRDRWVTGRDDDPAVLHVNGNIATGFGLAVAKASAAIALVAFDVAAAALQPVVADGGVSVLLAAGGTHRWPVLTNPTAGPASFGVGVRRALQRGFRPAGIVNVKAGAPTPLHEEPGAAYVTIRITGEWEPALFRGDAPGTIAAVAAMVDGVEQWRADIVRRPVSAGCVVGREAALGAIRTGDLEKPDLLPGLVEGRVFLVLGPDDEPARLADDLRIAIGAACVRVQLRVEIEVNVDVHEPSARTDPSDPLVVAARRAWAQHVGPVVEISGWRGSTDSCVFRAAGIPTVRMGPPAVRDDRDPRLDRVDLSVLLACTAATVDTLVRWTLAARPPGSETGSHRSHNGG